MFPLCCLLACIRMLEKKGGREEKEILRAQPPSSVFLFLSFLFLTLPSSSQRQEQQQEQLLQSFIFFLLLSPFSPSLYSILLLSLSLFLRLFFFFLFLSFFLRFVLQMKSLKHKAYSIVVVETLFFASYYRVCVMCMCSWANVIEILRDTHTTYILIHSVSKGALE